MATKKDLAISGIRNVHSNTVGSLEDVLDDLEDIRDLANELIEAVKTDIEMQSE